ncbi:MAG: hypothetical protein AMS19_04965 [Gemmatimonas sp. SG8_23]|nr:MAG: hypothetical protein AMS19_04965 [Gemmatimonas sp. SG8_23]
MAWLIGVLAVTQRPGTMGADEIRRLSSLCLLCGARGTSDAFLNLALFWPLGLVAARRFQSLPRSFLLGLCISGLVEAGQLSLPGRHASPADLLWNATGTMLGTVSHRLALRQIVVGLHVGAVTALVVPPVVLGGAGILSTHAPPPPPHYVQWTPHLEGAPLYGGSVLSMELDGRAVAPGILDEPPTSDSGPQEGFELSITLEVGPAPDDVAPVFRVHDEQDRDVRLIGVQASDLVLRERRLAASVKLDAPEVRVPDALAGARPEDTVVVRAARRGEETCVAVDARTWCGLGITPGRTWSYLLSLGNASEGRKRTLDLAWLLLLHFPIGFFAGARRGAAGGAAASLLAVAAVGLATPLRLATPLECLAVPLGVVLGRWVLERVRSSIRVDQRSGS